MEYFYKKITVIALLTLAGLPPLIFGINLAQAATYQHKVIKGCDGEYFILDGNEKRVPSGTSLDRSKSYSARLSIDTTKSKVECWDQDFITGYVQVENATAEDKSDSYDSKFIKDGKVTAKYIDACFTPSEFKLGNKSTKYADIDIKGNNSDKQVWRFFAPMIGDSSCEITKSGERIVFDIASTAWFTQTPWAGTSTAAANSNTTPPVNTAVGVNYNGTFDQELGTFSNPLDAETLPELMATILRILFALIGIISVIIIIIAGFRMVLASGNEAELTKAKQAITWAIVGLIVALMSFSIVAIVQKLIQG